MKQIPAPCDQAPGTGTTAPAPDEARRRLLRRSLGLATPVVLTLTSAPVAAVSCQTASAFYSANTYASRAAGNMASTESSGGGTGIGSGTSAGTGSSAAHTPNGNAYGYGTNNGGAYDKGNGYGYGAGKTPDQDVECK